MSIKLDYLNAVQFVNINGWDKFLEMFKEKYPQFELYSCSISWLYDEDYICKIKGIYGDLIINWED